MKSKKLQRKDTRNVWLLSVGLVLLSTLLIVWFMPRTDAFSYEYRVGQPWRYGTLYATEKFNIQMSDSAMEAQHDSLRRVFQPYFNMNTTVLPAMSAKLKAIKAPAGQAMQYNTAIRYATALLDSVYNRGIMSPVMRDSLMGEGISHVRLVRDNVANSVPLTSTFTQQQAYRYIVEQTTDTAMARMLTLLNLNTVLEDNLTYDVLKSDDEMQFLLSGLSTGIGFVMANEKIVDRGDIITPDTYLKLRSYEKVMREQNAENERLPYIIAGQAVMVLILLSVLMSYLHLFRRDYLEDMRPALLLYALLTLFSIIGSQMVARHFFHIFALPVCMLPIIVRVFLDSRTAYMFHTATVILISLVLTYPYEFIILQLVAGIIAIQNLRELNQRSQIIHTALVITLTYVIFYAAYQLTLGVQLVDIEHSILIYFLINGLLILFTYPLLWIIERGLGFVSDVTLVELTNINHPLLRRLSEEAPGTFQHSMQVANLSAEVANKIGAKAQLVRTGALYHDIGKMERPVFFTENQNGISPHRHLTPLKSAEVIIAHVKNGIALADKNHIPDSIKRFITTHHGLGKAKYFYITYKNEHPDEDIDEAAFTYPGPNPSTKEEAILMMCDAVEAASRSLPEYTEESINTLVDRIIDSQVSEGFFSECSITFKDIAVAKSVLKEKLKTIYHTRISYPELGENNENRE